VGVSTGALDRNELGGAFGYQSSTILTLIDLGLRSLDSLADVEISQDDRVFLLCSLVEFGYFRPNAHKEVARNWLEGKECENIYENAREKKLLSQLSRNQWKHGR
jgi:hypothetical protein